MKDTKEEQVKPLPPKDPRQYVSYLPRLWHVPYEVSCRPKLHALSSKCEDTGQWDIDDHPDFNLEDYLGGD